MYTVGAYEDIKTRHKFPSSIFFSPPLPLSLAGDDADGEICPQQHHPFRPKMSGQDRTSMLIPLLLALIPIAFSPLQPKDPLNQTLNLSPARNYIVRFLDYKIASDHRSYLEESLRSVGNWRWIERKNPAAAFPTDFGVVEVADSNRAHVIGEIEKLERVKDVYADSSYSRILFVDDGSEKDGSFFGEKKRPGKIFTSMSFEEGDGSDSPLINTTFSWKRNILMQVRSSLGFGMHFFCKFYYCIIIASNSRSLGASRILETSMTYKEVAELSI